MSDISIGREDWSDIIVDKNGELGLTKLVRWLYTVEDRVSMSLPAHLKRAVVESRTYITREAGMEENINDIMYCINVMYMGWCMTALSVNQMVNGSKIRDILSTVATESMEPEKVYKYTDDLFASMESFKKIKAPAFGPIIPHADTSDIDSTDDDLDIKGTSGSKVIEYPKDYRITSGITADVSFAVGAGKGKQMVSVPLTVRLNPTIIAAEAAKQFFASNFKMDTWMRWFKVKTGEISFFRDFLFELDLQAAENKAVRDDKTGTVKDMLEARQNSLSSYLLKLVGWRAERQNIASAIHIYTKSQFTEFCRSTHCNFDNVNDRLKYFRATFSMIVAVIDNEYQMVDMYFAGVGNKAKYQFSQLQNYTKPNQYDLTSVMRAFANTNAPRF